MTILFSFISTTGSGAGGAEKLAVWLVPAGDGITLSKVFCGMSGVYFFGLVVGLVLGMVLVDDGALLFGFLHDDVYLVGPITCLISIDGGISFTGL